MVSERIHLSRDATDVLEHELSLRRHVERYLMARQFLFGRVLDASCGVGYGSYLCQKNPDVSEVVGIDMDPTAIEWARANFHTGKARFLCQRLERFAETGFDCLLSLETIEHLDDPRSLAELAARTGVSEAIVSFPQKKTTHYNRFHRWDLTVQDIAVIFDGFAVVGQAEPDSDYVLMRLVRAARRLHPPRRWTSRPVTLHA